MENTNEQEDLLTELLAIETLVKENPCRMNNGLIGALKEVVRSFVGRYCIESASREQVARYLQRDVRTISRWAKEYNDFPNARHRGHRDIEFNWLEVVQWKLKHKELYEN